MLSERKSRLTALKVSPCTQDLSSLCSSLKRDSCFCIISKCTALLGKYVGHHVFSLNISICQFNELLLSLLYNQVSLVYRRYFIRCFSVQRLSGGSVLMTEVMQNYNICFKNSTSFIQLQNILVCMGLIGCLKAYRHLRACWHRLGYILLENSAIYVMREQVDSLLKAVSFMVKASKIWLWIWLKVSLVFYLILNNFKVSLISI